MPNYSTNLNTWGSTGQAPPTNYSYVEGEQPVDAWDNFLMSNIINDIEHLIDVTNNELLPTDGSTPLSGSLTDDQGNTIWNYSAGMAEVDMTLTASEPNYITAYLDINGQQVDSGVVGDPSISLSGSAAVSETSTLDVTLRADQSNTSDKTLNWTDVSIKRDLQVKDL